jgi:RND family efflux transporter MFP subunit
MESLDVIRVNAKTRPRWTIALKAQVNGVCISVTDKALAGRRVEKGDLLLVIESSTYMAQAHEAEAALSEARLNLMLANREYALASEDWKRSGISKKPSKLALNLPQLRHAEQVVDAAEARLVAARKKLDYTQIRAPFSGQVTARQISPGQSVSEGEELLQLIGQDRYEIIVSLSQSQWNRLAENWSGLQVPVANSAGDALGLATIKHGGGYIDPKTNSYKLFLEVDSSRYPNVVAGEFVRLQLPGRTLHETLSLPATALTRDGFIWYVDDQDYLQRFRTAALFYHDHEVVIRAPATDITGEDYPANWRIATTPLASFVAGTKVRPTGKLPL